MAKIIEMKKGMSTVGELIAALQTYPSDLPIQCGLCDDAVTYRTQPEHACEEAHVVIEGNDGCWE